MDEVHDCSRAASKSSCGVCGRTQVKFACIGCQVWLCDPVKEPTDKGKGTCVTRHVNGEGKRARKLIEPCEEHVHMEVDAHVVPTRHDCTYLEDAGQCGVCREGGQSNDTMFGCVACNVRLCHPSVRNCVTRHFRGKGVPCGDTFNHKCLPPTATPDTTTISPLLALATSTTHIQAALSSVPAAQLVQPRLTHQLTQPQLTHQLTQPQLTQPAAAIPAAAPTAPAGSRQRPMKMVQIRWSLPSAKGKVTRKRGREEDGLCSADGPIHANRHVTSSGGLALGPRLEIGNSMCNVGGLSACASALLEGRDVSKGLLMTGQLSMLGCEHACWVIGNAFVEGLYGLRKNAAEAEKWFREMPKCKLKNATTLSREKAANWLLDHGSPQGTVWDGPVQPVGHTPL